MPPYRTVSSLHTKFAATLISQSQPRRHPRHTTTEALLPSTSNISHNSRTHNNRKLSTKSLLKRNPLQPHTQHRRQDFFFFYHQTTESIKFISQPQPPSHRYCTSLGEKFYRRCRLIHQIHHTTTTALAPPSRPQGPTASPGSHGLPFTTTPTPLPPPPCQWAAATKAPLGFLVCCPARRSLRLIGNKYCRATAG